MSMQTLCLGTPSIVRGLDIISPSFMERKTRVGLRPDDGRGAIVVLGVAFVVADELASVRLGWRWVERVL
jgi:hypothetical protein